VPKKTSRPAIFLLRGIFGNAVSQELGDSKNRKNERVVPCEQPSPVIGMQDAPTFRTLRTFWTPPGSLATLPNAVEPGRLGEATLRTTLIDGSYYNI
jgi:hypothetical protein